MNQKFWSIAVLVQLSLGVSLAMAENLHYFRGSDTLAGMMTDAIIASGMEQELVYEGGGTGLGEKAIVNGQQGIAPMSRAFSADMLKKAEEKGLVMIPHVIALDGLGVFVHQQNPLQGTDLTLIKKIFTCQITQWENVPGSQINGTIKAYRRNDVSGTTDTFKSLVGIKEFGTCVTVMAETVDIAERTAKEPLAIGYSGGTAKRETNKILKLSKEEGGNMVEMTTLNVRNASYPLSRSLYVYEVSGARSPNKAEQKFLQDYLLDRSFLDPIIQDHEFYTLD